MIIAVIACGISSNSGSQTETDAATHSPNTPARAPNLPPEYWHCLDEQSGYPQIMECLGRYTQVLNSKFSVLYATILSNLDLDKQRELRLMQRESIVYSIRLCQSADESEEYREQRAGCFINFKKTQVKCLSKMKNSSNLYHLHKCFRPTATTGPSNTIGE
jgi:hypothetical protein